VNGPLVEQLKAAIAPHCTGSRYGLIDYPMYCNPGDAAIWLGTRWTLEQLIGTAPAYVSTLRGFDLHACRAAIGTSPVFLLGGGNFGSIYPRHHQLRLAAINSLRGQAVIQLPFSLAGLSDDLHLSAQTRDVLASHGQVALIARDRSSRDLASELLACDVALAPDAAHALTLAADEPSYDTTWLLRHDRETLSEVMPPAGADRWDWSTLGTLRRLNRFGKLASAFTPWARRLRLYDWLATAKVRAATIRLARARTVVTDRLHGMILAQAIQRHVIAHDNCTGKLSSYMATWGHDLNLVSLAARSRSKSL
jgi:exopolysaccharide biosynthesis predicted pyruvyltransferase EpsI